MANRDVVRGVEPAKVRRGQAREKVMAAAQSLIIAHGVEGVPIRAINAAAGVSPGIVHYHFGSMDRLVVALIGRHMEPLVRARRQLLDDRLQQASPTLRDVVEILVLPLATLAIEAGDEGMAYVRLLARLYGDRSPLLDEASDRWMGEINERLFALLKALLPRVEERDIVLRWSLASQVLLRGLEELHLTPRPWTVRWGLAMPPDPWDHVRQVMDFMVAGLAGEADP